MGRIYDNTISVDADGNATISGDLTVNGDTATISTTNSVISDKIIELANGTSGTPSGDSGIVVERGSSNNVFIGWDESEDKVTIGTGTFTGATTGDLSLTDAALKTGAITSSGVVTATGFTIGSAVINEAELETIDTITAGTVAASKAVVVDANKDASGFRNVTLTGELDAATLDISGDADIDGTLEADAITVDGTALAEYISDTVGAMVGSNTETGITVTYQDADNTIDFVLDQVTSLGTITQDTVTFDSANSQDPLLIIKNTTNDANGARLRFVKDKGAAGADNDVAGLIEFYADDDNQDQVLFGKIEGIVADASNGAEGGSISLSVATHDGEIQPGFTIQDGSAEDEIDVFIANGTSSVTTIAGDVKLDGAGLKIKEAPNAPADTAAYGQLWVKNETPCELYFTTDAGDDIQLTDGTSAAGGGGGSVSNDDANLILAIQSFS